MEKIKVWYDPEGDYLEVIFKQKEGYFRQTSADQVMEKVDLQGNILGLAELKRKDIDFEFLDKLSFYYIETRYPEEQFKLHKTVSKKLAGEYYKKTKRLCLWLERLLK